MPPKVVTDATFTDEVLEAPGTVLVDFWAEWCGPCRIISPALEEIGRELGTDLTIAKVNVDENELTPVRYGVRSIPALMLFRDGKLLDTRIGAAPKNTLRDWINAAWAKAEAGER